LRSSMGQERLNSMIVAAAHPDLLDCIDVCSVAGQFSMLNDARKQMYGIFA